MSNIVLKNGVGEIVEKKSRFIAHIYKIENEEQAVSYINEIKKQYWDARHNCFAYVAGIITNCKDFRMTVSHRERRESHCLTFL